MKQRGQLASEEEVSAAGREGLRGAVVGACKWGIYAAILGTTAYFFSPVYRGLTIQFKVFLQSSGMIAGSVIEAERSLRDYEVNARRIRKFKREQEVWQRYEKDFVDEDHGRALDQADRETRKDSKT